MRVGIIPASGGSFPVDPEVVSSVARRAEEVGFESIWIGEHVVMSDRERYPGADQRRVGPSPTGDLPDPLEWLTFVAARTERILLGTAVLILPVHRPAIIAKRVATLDRLSGGRVRLGIGVGWSEDEYEAVGESFATRGRRCDEAIDAVRALWRDSPADHDGEFYRFRSVQSSPKPAGGSVPVVVGGDSEAAARRAGIRGDGWLPFGKDPAELGRLLGVLRGAAEGAGRDPGSIELTALGSLRPEALRALADLGFTRMVLFLPSVTPQAVEDLWDRTRAALREAGL